MTEFGFYFAQIMDGIAYGCIYGVLALSIVLLYRSNKLFNFAQTELATLCVIGMFFLLKKFDYTIALLLTLCFSFIGGCLLHFCLMRFVTERRKVLHSNESVMTIGFFAIFNSLNFYLLGDEMNPFPTPFGFEMVAESTVSRHSLGILVVTLLLVTVFYLCFKFTRLGIIFEAIAENLAAARLRGIRTSNILALAWGFNVLLSAFAGILIAPVLFLSPVMLTNVFAYSLIAVVIGGLQSPLGALLGGIIVGVIENLAGNIPFIGSELRFLVIVLLLFIILVIKPRGLWGRKEGRRV